MKIIKKQLLDATIVLRCTQKEKNEISQKAKMCGITTSEFLRFRALNYEPKKALSEDEIEKIQAANDCKTSILRFAGAVEEYTKDVSKENRKRILIGGALWNDWILTMVSIIRILQPLVFKHLYKDKFLLDLKNRGLKKLFEDSISEEK